MKSKIDFEELERLISEKEYSELNKSELESIKKNMNEDEYSAQRNLILASSKCFRENNAVKLNQQNKQLLMNKMNMPSNSKIYSLVSFKIPAYQVAAVIAFFTLALFVDKSEIVYLNKYITKQDTVLLVKEVPKYIEKQIVVFKKANQNAVVKNEYSGGNDSAEISLYANQAFSQYNSSLVLSNIEASQNEKKGFSNSDDTIYKYLANFPRF